ncbi:MAG: F0F1 ATP synthase subunit B [Clostridia bacterium]|nr:F0F1 ATP synthase subunit B [Clostridia bacterium]MBR2323350.1 F0F1 ATP synthase subunit B [Clostridia bacterium]MBR6692565.1 F0F1 ATP synthase subunit B [Clostridia bacterium]
MPQSLDVISVNIWHIVVSLANLVLMYVIIKKIFYKPVKKMIVDRENAIKTKWDKANLAEDLANKNKAEWELKLGTAKQTADDIVKSAQEQAKLSAERIVEDANARADGIVNRAKAEAELEKRKAVEDVKREIIEVSGAIAQKLLEREVNTDDHRNLINSFLEEIGDGDEGNK